MQGKLILHQEERPRCAACKKRLAVKGKKSVVGFQTFNRYCSYCSCCHTLETLKKMEEGNSNRLTLSTV